MDKKNFWLIGIAVVLVLLFTLKGINLTFNPITFISFDNEGKFNVYQSCYDVSDTYTEGAMQGQCFQYIVSNKLESIRYIVSMTEKSASGGRTLCTVDTDVVSSSTISKCNGESWHNGAVEKTCSSGSECTSGTCTNLLCKQGLPSGGCTKDQLRCAFDSNTNFQSCLSNGQWSGNLYCGQGKYCSNGLCIATCAPKTCENIGKECGSWSNGCSGTLNCGSCTGGTCSNGICIENPSCTSKTCSQLNAECGSISNGCGSMIACGGCGTGKECSANQCITTSTTCDADTCSNLDLECGVWNDGCGGTINCGSCSSDKVCELGLCVKTEDVTNPNDVVNDSDNVVDGNVDNGNVVPTETTASQFDWSQTLFNIGDFEVKLWMIIVAVIGLILLVAVMKK